MDALRAYVSLEELPAVGFSSTCSSDDSSELGNFVRSNLAAYAFGGQGLRPRLGNVHSLGRELLQHSLLPVLGLVGDNNGWRPHSGPALDCPVAIRRPEAQPACRSGDGQQPLVEPQQATGASQEELQKRVDARWIGHSSSNRRGRSGHVVQPRLRLHRSCVPWSSLDDERNSPARITAHPVLSRNPHKYCPPPAKGELTRLQQPPRRRARA